MAVTNKTGRHKCDRLKVHPITFQVLLPLWKCSLWPLYQMDMLDKSNHWHKTKASQSIMWFFVAQCWEVTSYMWLNLWWRRQTQYFFIMIIIKITTFCSQLFLIVAHHIQWPCDHIPMKTVPLGTTGQHGLYRFTLDPLVPLTNRHKPMQND